MTYSYDNFRLYVRTQYLETREMRTTKPSNKIICFYENMYCTKLKCIQ